VLDAPGLGPVMAGQHIDLRLTAHDGYTAQRAYSLSSAAGDGPIEITVDRIDAGEVSPYLVDDLQIGHAIEVRGPIGMFFVWTPEQPEPVQLIAGGSGIVPLMSMIRTRRRSVSRAPFRLLYSARRPDARFYTDELDAIRSEAGVDVDYVFTRQIPEGWPREAGRLSPALLAELTVPPTLNPSVYVCGPTPFVETVLTGLVDLGHPEENLRAERFGPSG
jgi:ferredoxin-NADP reductase